MFSRAMALAIAAALMLATVALIAQPPAGGGGRGQGGFGQRGMMGGGNSSLQLVSRKDVQDDLKITEAQKKQLDELNAKMREEMQAMRENMQAGGGDPQGMRAQMEKMNADYAKKVDAILTPEQQKRLKEIRVQLDGNRAILNADVQKELGITADQKAKIDAAQKAMNDKRQAMMEEMRNGGGDRQTMQESMKKMNDEFNADLAKVLTAEQAAKLKTMGGAPFKAAPPQQGGGFGGGNRGGGGGTGGSKGTTGGGF